MIWWTIALFAISFLVTALLAPKPEIENARAQDLSPDSFPRATEDAPIPLVLGRVRMNAPNTLDYGDFTAVPIKEKVKTGLFSSTTIVKGHKYYLGMDLGLCLGPTALLYGIYVDEEQVFDGTSLYTEEARSFWLDDTINFSTSTVSYESIDLLAELGLTAVEYDALATLGSLTVNVKITVSSYLTALAGGGPSTGGYGLQADFYTDIGDPTGSLITPSEGVGATSDSKTAGGDFTLSVNLTCPAGARYFRYGSQLSPALILFNTLSVDQGSPDSFAQISGVGIATSKVLSSNINEPELFGGNENGGGLIGDFTFYPGDFDQVVDPYMESLSGVDNVTAYRGMAHIVLGDASSGPLYIGESPNLRKTSFDIAVYTDNLYARIANRVQIGFDINPAEALYEIMTNDWRGLGIDASFIDIDSFVDSALTLHSENFGISCVVTAASNAKKIVGEILRTIDGIMYQDPTTGKFTLKLIRDDYTPGSLIIYDEDDIVAIRSLTKTAWEDVVSEVKVSYSTREKDTGKVAIAQDMAVANMIGRRKTSSISFPFVYDATVANLIAARELSQLSVPLMKVTLEMNRNGYKIKPGDVFKMSFPEFGISEVVLRANNYDLGELLNNKVVLECVEDKFGVGTVVFAEPTDSAWTNPVPTPQDVTSSLVVETPYFFSSNIEFPGMDGYGNVIPFPISAAASASSGFSLKSGTVTGSQNIGDQTNVSYPVTCQLDAAYLDTAGFDAGLDATGFTVKNVVGTLVAGTLAEIQAGESGIIYANGEWMGFTGVTDNLDTTYTLTGVYRGLLGSMAVSHAADDQIFVLTTDLLGTGLLSDELLEDGTVYYKILDIAGAKSQDPLSLSEVSFVLSDVADRPVRPRDLNIDSARTEVPWDAALDPTVSLSWLNSNRDAGQISIETDATETPDQAEQYDLEVWLDGVEQVSLSDDNITSPYALDISSLSGTSGELRLYAKRTGGDAKKSVYYAKYPFLLVNLEKLSGDMQSGGDYLLTSGDEQSATDGIKLSGDEA